MNRSQPSDFEVATDFLVLAAAVVAGAAAGIGILAKNTIESWFK